MRAAWARLRASITDRPVVHVDETRARVLVCDTSCRAAAARDRTVTSYLTVAGPR